MTKRAVDLVRQSPHDLDRLHLGRGDGRDGAVRGGGASDVWATGLDPQAHAPGADEPIAQIGALQHGVQRRAPTHAAVDGAGADLLILTLHEGQFAARLKTQVQQGGRRGLAVDVEGLDGRPRLGLGWQGRREHEQDAGRGQRTAFAASRADGQRCCEGYQRRASGKTGTVKALTQPRDKSAKRRDRAGSYSRLTIRRPSSAVSMRMGRSAVRRCSSGCGPSRGRTTVTRVRPRAGSARISG